MNLIQYLFFRIYSIQRKRFGEIESSLVSIMTITCLIFINLITIGIFLEVLTNLQMIIDTPLKVLVLMVIIFGLLSFIFLHQGRYKLIEQKYFDESNRSKIFGTLRIIAYIALSFILFFISVGIG